MRKYFGSFTDYENVLHEFSEYSSGNWDNRDPLPGIVPEPSELLFASYGGESYTGDAVVIFRKDNKLYEVHGSHCSCFGLEGQWNPEETGVGALARRLRKTVEKPYYYFLYDHSDEAVDAYWRLVENLKKEN